jgi:hypothetical protein
MVGKEYVGAMDAFLTNDVAAVRARHEVITETHAGTADEPSTTQELNRSVLVVRQ